MKQKDEFDLRLDEAFWEVNATASRLISYGCGVSARHLQDRRLRMQFNRELAYYARRVVEDVYERRISPDEGLGLIKREKESLYAQSSRILNQLGGMAGGASQVVTGVGSCLGSYGVGCVARGGPIFAHGVNNFYENAKGLYEGRTDVVGPVRKRYQDAAKRLGYEEREGNIAYYSADLYLSGRALRRMVPRRDAWRLFRYMDSDKERAFRQMSKAGLTLEVATSSITIKDLINEILK
ncbi:DUF4225 domain-containing protein [Pseudomonas entomophila]|uniref:DUF4225 domain-containing protein n=1 Tax=Pseudomonas entomophila TaxID=312306 RepID=UPI0024057C28|nr:DUF4225 domain-containing protein [Pseudomonas entomophila]MDF9619805.1 DUF4225 domain-containing protein [Pseudomonas entomophila]